MNKNPARTRSAISEHQARDLRTEVKTVETSNVVYSKNKCNAFFLFKVGMLDFENMYIACPLLY